MSASTQHQAQLSSLTIHDLSNRDRVIIALPIGSCEQHGPHLPLDTDTRIAIALSTHLARENLNVVVAPAISITASGEHRGFAGTLSIGTSALATVLIEIVRSADWAAGIVFVNGHGGNGQAVRDALSVLQREQRRVSSWWPLLANADAHAGCTETSLMLAIASDDVHMHRAEVGVTTPLSKISRDLQIGGMLSVSPNGILGDPRLATKISGERLFAELGAQLLQHVQHECSTWLP